MIGPTHRPLATSMANTILESLFFFKISFWKGLNLSRINHRLSEMATHSPAPTTTDCFLAAPNQSKDNPQDLNGQPSSPTVKNPLSLNFACDFISSTSQFAHTNFPFKNLASGLHAHTMNEAGKLAKGFC